MKGFLRWLRAEWDRALGAVLILAGGVCLVVTYTAVANDRFVAEQMAELASGGLGGLFLVAVGVMLRLQADHHDEWRNSTASRRPCGARPGPSRPRSWRPRRRRRSPVLAGAGMVVAAVVIALGYHQAAGTGDVADATTGLGISVAGLVLAGLVVGLAQLVSRSRLAVRKAQLLGAWFWPRPPALAGGGNADGFVLTAPGLTRSHHDGCPTLAAPSRSGPPGRRQRPPHRLPDLRSVVNDLLPYLVIGVTTGAVFALASMGLVVTYTTSGVFNFAHGAVGMFATFIFQELRSAHGWPTPLAMAAAILVVAPLLGVLIDRVLLARLQGAPAATYVVVSLGLLVALESTAVAVFGGQTRQVAPFFPTGSFELAGVQVGYDQAWVVAIAVLAAVGLGAFFRFTHLGLQTLAVVGDPDLTELVGTNARAVTTFSWLLGSSFAALSGVLFAPVVGLDAVLLTLLVVQAFGAAVVGRLRSLPLTNLGGLRIAIAAALSTSYAASNPSLVGLPSSLPFIVLFGVLVASPKGFFAEVAAKTGSGRATRASRRPPCRFRWSGGTRRTAPALPTARWRSWRRTRRHHALATQRRTDEQSPRAARKPPQGNAARDQHRSLRAHRP